MNSHHAKLFDHMRAAALLGYSHVTLPQLLCADRAAWLHMADKVTTFKRDAHGNPTLEDEIKKVLSHPSVNFHLLPAKVAPEKPQPKATITKEGCSRTPPRRPNPFQFLSLGC
jgi:hypothetical protein